jgi:hypothetical protein
MKTTHNTHKDKATMTSMIAKQILEDDNLSEKLIKWIDDPHRGKATATFGEGIERQVALRFETLFERLKSINKADGSTGPSGQTQ